MNRPETGEYVSIDQINLDGLQKDMRRIGQLPRAFSFALFLTSCAALAYPYLEYRDHIYLAAMFVLAVPLALSFRVRARIVGNTFVFRSYFRTYTFAFADVEEFMWMNYYGLWVGGAGIAWIYQIDVETRDYKKLYALSGTMCGRKTALRIERGLNALVASSRDPHGSALPE